MNKELTGIIVTVAIVIGFLTIYSQTGHPVKLASNQAASGGYGAAAPAAGAHGGATAPASGGYGASAPAPAAGGWFRLLPGPGHFCAR